MGMGPREGAAVEDVARSEALMVQLLAQGDDAVGDGMGTSELAAACAELDVVIDRLNDEAKLKGEVLMAARRELLSRFDADDVDQVRVLTTAGKKLVHLRSTYFVGVDVANKPQVLAWLKENVPDLVKEAYNDASFKAHCRRAQFEGDGVFPEPLMDAGIVKVTSGKEIAFRKSG